MFPHLAVESQNLFVVLSSALVLNTINNFIIDHGLAIMASFENRQGFFVDVFQVKFFIGFILFEDIGQLISFVFAILASKDKDRIFGNLAAAGIA